MPAGAPIHVRMEHGVPSIAPSSSDMRLDMSDRSFRAEPSSEILLFSSGASNAEMGGRGVKLARKIGENTMRLWAQFLTAAILATAVPVANAQVQSPAPSPSEPSQNIPDQKLDATAAALDKIADVKQNYSQQIEATPNEADKRRLVDEANKELVKAVTDQGLSVEEYTKIMVVAQSDPNVRQKIIQRMRPNNR